MYVRMYVCSITGLSLGLRFPISTFSVSPSSLLRKDTIPLVSKERKQRKGRGGKRKEKKRTERRRRRFQMDMFFCFCFCGEKKTTEAYFASRRLEMKRNYRKIVLQVFTCRCVYGSRRGEEVEFEIYLLRNENLRKPAISEFGKVRGANRSITTDWALDNSRTQARVTPTL